MTRPNDAITARVHATGRLGGDEYRQLIDDGLAPPWAPEVVSQGNVTVDMYTQWAQAFD